ncbi:MAG: DNA-binding protein [Thermoprotei archaeon]|nr:MAG: DNA-binding protein [Thermoprotei archaeon]
MSLKLAISDTCFIIDWAYYRRRSVLIEIFKTVLVPEQVLAEIEDEESISWVSAQLARGNMLLFTPSPADLRKAEKLILKIASKPFLKRVDLPEAICLVIGQRLNAIVLTENRGALLATKTLNDLKNVVVWRALEVLTEAITRKIIRVRSREDVERVFKEYEDDTKHIFPRSDLKHAINRVIKCLKL